MLKPADTQRALLQRLLLIVLSAVAMFLAVLVVGPRLSGHADEPVHTAVAAPIETGAPIAAEADVFRLDPAHFGPPTDAARRSMAHLRTLAMYRSLRAYPGAPPRVPHGLTADEFREPTCNSCHRRGGYVARFGAYAPVTPHPEYTGCLQCHVADDAVVGVRFADAVLAGGDATCGQCHVPGLSARRFVLQEWRPASWPGLGRRAMEGAPPVIPHGLQLRGNCLACHAGPAAVAEIRTTHPERANCRQCHLPAYDEEPVFTRPLDAATAATGVDS